ncbi:MAG: hypothetical protein JO353_11210 [Phycisphaerae bacterium]|nr:hypothetical protein [Phycisphaerae bacterium]
MGTNGMDGQPQPLSYADPDADWLRSLHTGAILGMVAALVVALWNYVLIVNRVQGMPRGDMLRTISTLVTTGIAALRWMSGWMLSGPSPIHDPDDDRRFYARIQSAMVFLLRLTLTIVFVTWSLRGLRLIGSSGGLYGYNALFRYIVNGGDALTILLLWLHIAALAAQLRLRGFRRLAMGVLIIAGGARLIWGVAPIVATQMKFNWGLRQADDTTRFVAFIIASVIELLVLRRFASLIRVDDFVPPAMDSLRMSGGT